MIKLAGLALALVLASQGARADCPCFPISEDIDVSPTRLVSPRTYEITMQRTRRDVARKSLEIQQRMDEANYDREREDEFRQRHYFRPCFGLDGQWLRGPSVCEAGED